MALRSLWKPGGKNQSSEESQKLFIESLSRLHDFRVNDTLTDLTLIVDEVSFRAHKLILSVHSQVFEAMLTNEMLEARKGEVRIKGVSSHIFSLFLNYVYTGAVPNDIQHSDAVDLFVCADMYQVESLVALCEKIIGSRLDAKNVIKVVFMAETYRRPFLKKRAAAYIRLYITDVVKTEDWPLISTNPRVLRKLILWSSKKVVGNLLVDSIKYGLRTPWVCLHRECPGTQILDWTIVPDMRPVEFKLYNSRPRGVTNFCMIFNWRQKATGGAEFIAYIYPHSRMKSSHATAFCHLTLWVDHKRVKLLDEEYLLTWYANHAHQTMGNRRVEVFRCNVPSTPAILTCAVEVHERTTTTKHYQLRMSDNLITKTVQPWDIEKDTEEVELSKITKPVVLNFDNVKFKVDEQRLSQLSALYSKRHECPLPSYPEEHFIPSIPELSAGHIARYINTGKLPARDKVDLNLLKAAWELQLSDLIVYLEQAIVYDFDSTNSVEALLLGHSLGSGFLKWSALQYMKANLLRVIRWDKNWPRLEAPLLEQLLFEQNRDWSPCLLPPYLIYRNKPSRGDSVLSQE